MREIGGKRTRVVRVDAKRPDPAAVREAARALARGGLVVFPTETVYGLGADATDGEAVRGIFAAKGRPFDNPLIVHVAAPADVAPLVREVPAAAEALARAFWPGPLSIVLPRTGRIAPEVSCGLDTVAIRMPAHPVALELIRLAGVPVAAPSANVSGRPSPTRAEDALADLDGRVDYVIDAGPCPVGVESTVLDLTGEVPLVLRPGGVTVEDLERVVGEVHVLGGRPAGSPGPGRPAKPAPAEAARSPGLRHRHYAPRARLVLVLPGGGQAAAAEGAATAIAGVVAAETSAGRRVGVACTRETASALSGLLPTPGAAPAAAGVAPAAPVVVAWGGRRETGEVAARLFSVLRDLDRLGVDSIVAEGAPPAGLGLAVNDRLGRAAAEVVDLAAPRGPASVEAAPRGPDLALSAPRPPDRPAARPEVILLVCSGNTCRSPMGAAILNDLLRRRGLDRCYLAESAGTCALDGEAASPEAVRIMAERGLDLSDHRSRRVSGDIVAGARLILTMERRHKQAILDLYPGAADRTFTLKEFARLTEEPEDIADPIGQGVEVYRRSAAEIERAAGKAVERLLNPLDFSGLVGRDEPSGEETTK